MSKWASPIWSHYDSCQCQNELLLSGLIIWFMSMSKWASPIWALPDQMISELHCSRYNWTSGVRGKTLKKRSYNSYHEASEYLFLSVEMHRHWNGPCFTFIPRMRSTVSEKVTNESPSQMAPNHTALFYLFRCFLNVYLRDERTRNEVNYINEPLSHNERW